MVFDKVRVIVLGGRICGSGAPPIAFLQQHQLIQMKRMIMKIICRSFPIYNLLDCSVIYHRLWFHSGILVTQQMVKTND